MKVKVYLSAYQIVTVEVPGEWSEKGDERIRAEELALDKAKDHSPDWQVEESEPVVMNAASR